MRLRTVLVALVACTLASPLAAADGAVEPCPEGYGTLVLGRGACVKFEVHNPFEFVPNPIFPQTTACSTARDSIGLNATWGNATLRVCGRAGAQPPTSTTPGIRYSLTRCGPGVDPVVEAFGGMVYFCVDAVPSIGDLGVPIEVDLHPCPGGFDPSVTIGGTTVEICVVVLT